LISTPSRRITAAAALALFALVFVLFVYCERPGLGLGHFFYIAIALAALAGGTTAGVSSGLLAAVLYALGVSLNPYVPTSTLPTFPTLIRAVTFVAIGTLVGWFATRHRQLLSEMAVLADRDVLTGLPNTRAFEAAITRHLDDDKPFALLVADLDGLDDGNAGSNSLSTGEDSLRSVANMLALSMQPGTEIARIGGDEFAVIAHGPQSGGGRQLAVSLQERLASSGIAVTFGWAFYPDDGDNALTLYRAANERLYARKLVNGGRILAVAGR
jgi:diguanylate cyclase (GGDEF)-like protein